MTVVTVGIIGIMTVLMAVQLKSLKGEYGLYLVLAAACVIFFYGTLRLKGILDGLRLYCCKRPKGRAARQS